MISVLAPLFASAVMVAAPTPGTNTALAPCLSRVALRLDQERGSFDGMSQSGVLMVLRNIGSAACFIPGLPKLQFDDAAGRDLDVLRETPPGMHPGPVITPFVLAPGAEASAALTWLRGDVYGGRHCVAPTKVAISQGSEAPTALWRFGQLCGEPGKPISFRQPVLREGSVPPP